MKNFVKDKWVYWKDADKEAIARAIVAVSKMYERLRSVAAIIRKILPSISYANGYYDLDIELDRIEDLLASIDNEEEYKS